MMQSNQSNSVEAARTLASSPSSSFMHDSYTDEDLLAAVISDGDAEDVQEATSALSLSAELLHHLRADDTADMRKARSDAEQTVPAAAIETSAAVTAASANVGLPPLVAAAAAAAAAAAGPVAVTAPPPNQPTHRAPDTADASVALSSSRLFVEFDSRNDAIRSLLFDGTLDTPQSPVHHQHEETGDDMQQLPPLQEITLFGGDDTVSYGQHDSDAASSKSDDTASSPPMPIVVDGLDFLPSIDAIVRDPESLPPSVLARSHGVDALEAMRADSTPPVALSAIFPSSLPSPRPRWDLDQTRRDTESLLRYSTPPLPTTTLRRSISDTEPRPSSARLTPFKSDGAVGVHRASTPSAMPLRQHSSLSMQQAVAQGIIAPFRATSRRASTASMTNGTSPRHASSSSVHPFVDTAQEDGGGGVASPSQLRRLKAHLDAYVAECMTHMQQQMEACTRQYLHQLQAALPPTRSQSRAAAASRAPSRSASVTPSIDRSSSATASPHATRSTLHASTLGSSALPALAPLPHPLHVHSTPPAPTSLKRASTTQPTTQTPTRGTPMRRQATPPIRG